MKVLPMLYGISCSPLVGLSSTRVDVPTQAVFGATRTPASISNGSGPRSLCQSQAISILGSSKLHPMEGYKFDKDSQPQQCDSGL
jgi:hypothetical protein